MKFRGELVGEKGFAAALALLLPVGQSAGERMAASCWAAGLWISKSAWKWALGGLSKNAAHSLDQAILVIGIPPVLFFVALFFYVRRRSRSWRGEKEAAPASDLDSAAPADASTRAPS